MRLDHLLSKEEITFSVRSNPTKTGEEVKSCCLLLSCQGVKEEVLRASGSKGPRRDRRTKLRSNARKTSLRTRAFWWRCAQGQHPFPSRTRWLRPERPMVLHWRRCGRVGGRQFKKEKRRCFGLGSFRNLRLERTSPRNLKYQPTNARKDRAKSLGINTGMGGQQSVGPTPSAGQCCENAGFTSDQSPKEILNSDD